MLTDCMIKARSPDYSSGSIFFLFKIFDQKLHIILFVSRLKYVSLIEPIQYKCLIQKSGLPNQCIKLNTRNRGISNNSMIINLSSTFCNGPKYY